MVFILKQGAAKTRWWPKVASVEIAVGALLYSDGSGAVQLADATSGQHLGVSQKKITLSDADYTANTKIPVLELQPDLVFEATVTGSFTAANVGDLLDLSDSVTVNADATSKLVVLCVGFISSTKGLFKINSAAAVFGVATT